MKYNTKTIEFFLQQINEGNTVGQETPFFRGDTSLRKANLPFEPTKEEMEEYAKCYSDTIYFAEKYCKIRLGNGVINNFELYDFQKEYLNLLENHKHVINLKARQSGISYMHAIYFLKRMLFSNDKTYVIMSCNIDEAKNFISKVSTIYKNLPFFLKSGIKSYNQRSIRLDNGCKLIACSTLDDYHIDEIIIEEFAFLEQHAIEALYKIICAMSPKIIISSTPKGNNFFKKLWDDANLNPFDENWNYYKPFSVRWDQIPNRDEKWKQKTIKEIGSLKAFEQEYELKFRSDVYNTETINYIREQTNNGAIIKHDENPWFNDEIDVRKTGVLFELSEEEKIIKEKVLNDIFYFAENFCQIKKDDKTISNIVLRDYQKNVLESFKNDKIIMLASRQVGTSIPLAIHILHSLMNGKNIMSVANLVCTCLELIDKVKTLYQRLPFYLKPGAKCWNQKQISFDNGATLRSAARTKTPALGFVPDELIIQDFAHIPPNIIENYYKEVYPVMNATKNSKIIITSTPNGDNLFKKIWDEANSNTNDTNYTPIYLPYNVVDGRNVTYFGLNKDKLSEFNINKEEILEQTKKAFPLGECFLKFDDMTKKDTIYISNEQHDIDDVRKFTFIKDNKEIKIKDLARISSWKEDTIKEIGSLEVFEQEFELKFHPSNHKSIKTLSERIEYLENVIEKMTKKYPI